MSALSARRRGVHAPVHRGLDRGRPAAIGGGLRQRIGTGVVVLDVEAPGHLLPPLGAGGDRREVPLSKAALRIWKAVGPFAITPAQADIHFRKSCAKAGIVGLHFHDSRATAITRLAAKLASLPDDTQRVQQAYALLYGRPPTDREKADALALIREVCREHGAALLLVSHDEEVLGQFETRRDFAAINEAGRSAGSPRPAAPGSR